MAYRVTRPFVDKVTGVEYHTGESYEGEDNRLKELLYGQYPAIESVPDDYESVPDDYEFNKIAEPEPEQTSEPEQTNVV